MRLIRSGSLTPGVDPTAWGLPAGTALRYEAPAPSLRPLFPSYAILDSDPAVWTGPDSWLLPSAGQVWIVLADVPVTVSLRRRRPAPLGAAILLGTTSQAAPVTSRGGVSIVVDVCPMGWARLFGPTAETFRDRIVPLGDLLGADWTEALIARLHGSDRAGQVKLILDELIDAAAAA